MHATYVDAVCFDCKRCGNLIGCHVFDILEVPQIFLNHACRKYTIIMMDEIYIAFQGYITS